MFQFTALNNTTLFKTLPDRNQIAVSAKTKYPVVTLVTADEFYVKATIGFGSGTWWFDLRDWAIAPEQVNQETNKPTKHDGITTAKFSMNLQRSPTLLYGTLAFRRDGRRLKEVRATSGQPGYQYKEAWKLRGKGPIPPDDIWKINTHGYYLSTPGIEGTFFHITPDPHPPTGRAEFGIHRDSNVIHFPGSAGCIVTSTEDFNSVVKPLIKKVDQAHIPLTVTYNH